MTEAPRVLHFSAFINPRRACAARVTVVVSALHLTYRMFIRPTNDTLTGKEDQNICGVFSENAPLQS